jgi:hypothetical protein
MLYAARSAAEADAPWVQPGDRPTAVGPVECSQAWLAGLAEDEAAEHGLERAAVAGVPPVPGLGNPPTLDEANGVPTWVWSDAGLANLRAHCIAAVKAEAERRILERYPLTAQINAIRLGQPLDWIDAVRAASDAIEATLPSDAVGLAAFSAAQADGWPE